MKTHAKHARHGTSRGFSLIELMVSMVVSGIILMGIFAFSTVQQATAVIHRRSVRVQQALEGSMHALARDVRMAGLGFSRVCSEIRVFDAASGRLINPGSVDVGNVANAVIDDFTTEPYWVLRDGLQAHWRSSPDVAVTIEGTLNASSALDSAADSFDVILGEGNYTSGLGLFTLSESPTAGGGIARFQTGANVAQPLMSDDAAHLEQMRQLFPPGSFVLIAAAAAPGADPFRPERQSQCVLLQVTGEVESGPQPTDWELPIDGASGFNSNLAALFDTNQPTDAKPIGVASDARDWDPDTTHVAGALVIPVGRLRWSRYEIDYTQPVRPYLVRTDIIGWRLGDPTYASAGDYPGCPAKECRLPVLRLPNAQVIPPRVAIGPMIEDMQVSVGCDGYGVGDAAAVAALIADPDPGFEEKGPATGGPLDLLPNNQVDEWNIANDRGNDEWAGNAFEEQWGPDCVYFGTGERARAEWAASGPASEGRPIPGFRLTPQTMRVTLLAKSETAATNAGEDIADDFYNKLFAIEDRPEMVPVAGQREYVTLTERFSPRNLRWRDPAML